MAPKKFTPNQQLLTAYPSRSNYGTTQRREPSSAKQQSTCMRRLKVAGVALLAIIGTLVILIYVVIPLLVYSSSTVRRNILFLSFLSRAHGLSDPESFGLNCSRNFFITSDPGIRLGTWYIQSQHERECLADKTWFPGESTTILYLHGITKTRGAHKRVALMKKLAGQVQTHVVAIDYRSFGDSTNETPSLDGVVADALAAYKRLRKIMPKSKVVIWGHSLGTSVSVYLAAKLHQMNEDPAAIILEAPLDSIGNVIGHSRFAKPYVRLPYFNALITVPFETDPNTALNSTAMVSKLNPRVPILMLHAQDDSIIPIHHGLCLYKEIRKAREGVSDAKTVTFISFSSKHGFGHSGITFYENLAGIVRKFLDSNNNGTSGMQIGL